LLSLKTPEGENPRLEKSVTDKELDLGEAKALLENHDSARLTETSGRVSCEE
jgi:hypothetical protein